MRRRSRAGGEPVITRRRKATKPKRRNAPKGARPPKHTAADANEKIALLEQRLNDALEQQSATYEVLRVISSSPGKLSPVFSAMLDNAARVCEAKLGILALYEGNGKFRVAAMHGAPPELAEKRTREPVFTPGPSNNVAIVAKSKKVQHVPDLRLDQSYIERDPAAVVLAELAGARTLIVVPILKDNELVGVFAIYRQEVRPFTDKQIELVQNFAAQAVIAIENTRLLNELRQRTDDLSEALEQQTATSDVLRVISSSPTDVQPVFDAIAESAVRLCDGQFSFVVRFDGKVMDFASCCGLSAEGLDAFHSILPMPASEYTAAGRAIVRRAVVEISDVETDPSYGAQAQGLAKAVIYRSIAAVPLLHEGNPIGAIAVARANAGSFPKRQIVLLQAFADQAVIAIENVRLFDEVQKRTQELSEALEQQTATADVLKVISRSLVDLETVLETLVETVARLCRADQVYMFHLRHDMWHLVAAWGLSAEAREFFLTHPFTPGRGSTSGRAALERRAVLIPDVLQDPEYALSEGQKIAGYRTTLGIPLLREDTLIGVFSISRTRVEAFTEKEIELATTFADQAVIAIENVRLFDEVQARTKELTESLRQQTATADVLKVISRSTFDLQTVLNTLTESAARLCEADMAAIIRQKGAANYWATTYGFPPGLSEYLKSIPIEAGRGAVVGRVLMEGKTVHVSDVLADPEYTFMEVQRRASYRTMLGVPLLREGMPIGIVLLMRRTVQPFTDRQIELVTTFADQAAIAIENVRLFESVEARTRELAKSLEELRTAQDRLVQTEKLASLGQLTAGIAHEIKNPLNFVNNFSAISVELIDELREALAGANLDAKLRAQINEIADMLQGNLDKVVQHGKRADSIVKNMLLHSRQGSQRAPAHRYQRPCR